MCVKVEPKKRELEITFGILAPFGSKCCTKHIEGGGELKEIQIKVLYKVPRLFSADYILDFGIFDTLGTPDISAIKCVKNPSLNVLGIVSVRYFVKMRILNSPDS